MKNLVLRVLVVTGALLVNALLLSGGALAEEPSATNFYPFGFRLGMTLQEIVEKTELTPDLSSANVYTVKKPANEFAGMTTIKLFVTPEHGLCKVLAMQENIPGDKVEIQKASIPWQDKFTKLYSDGKKSDPGKLDFKSLWTNTDTSPDTSRFVALSGYSDNSSGFLMLEFEAKFIDRCIEWNTSHSDLPKWKYEAQRNIDEAEAAVASRLNHEEHPRLPKKFAGDSIPDLVKKFEDTDTLAKDEFIKKSEVKAKRELLQNKTYKFAFSPKGNFQTNAKYDAENEILNISYKPQRMDLSWSQAGKPGLMQREYRVVELAVKIDSSKYTGQNSYGASAKITKTNSYVYGIALNNWRFDELISISKHLPPQEAKALKEDFAYYIEVELVPVDVTDESVKWYVITGEKPTISKPEEFHSFQRYLLANLMKVGIFRVSTGEVIGWKKVTSRP